MSSSWRAWKWASLILLLVYDAALIGLPWALGHEFMWEWQIRCFLLTAPSLASGWSHPHALPGFRRNLILVSLMQCALVASRFAGEWPLMLAGLVIAPFGFRELCRTFNWGTRPVDQTSGPGAV
jgi:hypothetical protein